MCIYLCGTCGTESVCHFRRHKSLSLLLQIFLTQELSPGLLHYRQILYQLSYQGSPI